jgi:hypothetical protein
LFCATYIEPEGSVYFNRNAYGDIENSILHLGIESVCILGDLISRTGQLNDLIEENKYVEDNSNDKICIMGKRFSKDAIVNNMGNELIHFL